jgi:hypothetical protein
MRSLASSPAVGRAQVALAAALVALGCATPPPPVAPAPGAATPVADDDVDLTIARDVLRHAERFKTSAVGESGDRPRESEALCLLAATGDEAGLRRLAAEATPAGQLFALAGLARVAPATYAELLPAFRTRTDEVGYFFYCEFGGKPVGELVRELEETALLDGVIGPGPWRGVSGLEDRAELAVIVSEVVDALPEPALALHLLSLRADEGSSEQREAVASTLRRWLDDPLSSDEATALLALVLGRPAALLEARSPRAVVRLIEELEDEARFDDEDERVARDRVEAALDARLAIEHDPRLRYLLEEALANVRGL